MSVLQPIVTSKLLDFLDEMVYRSTVKIDGEYKNYAVFKTVKEDNVLRKYVYLETEEGYVEEAQLFSINNELLAVEPFSIEKKDDGLILAFEFRLSVEG